MDKPIQTTLIDAVQFLDAEAIPYALIGGLAVSLRSQPRVTVDVDFVIAAELDRALAVLAKLDQSKFEPLFSDVASVIRASFILPLRHRSTKVKVDIAVGLSGFERQTVMRAKPINLPELNVIVATAEDLLLMKVLAGRPRDEEDIRSLITARGDRLDWDYCDKTAAELSDALAEDLVGRIRALRKSM